MNLLSLGAAAALLAAWAGASAQFSLPMCLLAFLVCFLGTALAVFAMQSGLLFRSLAAAAGVLAALASAGTGSLWTFLWVFTLADAAAILLALLFLILFCSRVDLDAPQSEEDDPLYRKVMYLYIRALMDLVLVRLRTEGLEKTPKEGRFLLVCNHLFLADPGILLHCFRRSQVAFVTKQENYRLPIINAFMHKTLCQPIDRENDRSALKTILKCIQLIKEDKVSVAVFPEGYTSKDGKLHPFRPGVFKIAQRTQVPIAVCTIQGTRKIFKNLGRLKTTPVALHLVKVIAPDEYTGKSTAEISDMVYETMIGDLGETFRYTE